MPASTDGLKNTTLPDEVMGNRAPTTPVNVSGGSAGVAMPAGALASAVVVAAHCGLPALSKPCSGWRSTDCVTPSELDQPRSPFS